MMKQFYLTIKILLCLIVFTPCLVFAEEEPDQIKQTIQETKDETAQEFEDPQEVVAPSKPEVISPSEISYKAQFYKTLIAVILILLIVLFFIWILRRFSPSQAFHANSRKNIKILERRHLSPNTYLYHIQVGEKQFIIAESKFQVSTVATLDWNEPVD